jgi:hypothetical protein
VELKESQKVRLRRLAAKAVVKEHELILPLDAPPAEAASWLLGLLQELIPAEAAAPVPSTTS